MKKLLFLLFLLPSLSYGQLDKVFGEINRDYTSLLLDQNESHCMVFDQYKKIGLIFNLSSGAWVHTINLDGLVPNNISRLRPDIFDFKDGKVILAGMEGGISPGHYFILDEARDIFHLHGQFIAEDHGPIRDVIGDWVIFSFNKFDQNKKGEYNFDKVIGSVVQYYNYMTKEWRSQSFDRAMTNVIAAKNVVVLESGKPNNVLDLMSGDPKQTTSEDFYTLVTSMTDGKVFTATRTKGGSLESIAEINPETLAVGNFSKKDPNTKYVWTPMWSYMVRLDTKMNPSNEFTDVDLVILDKKSGAQLEARISPVDLAENQALMTLHDDLVEKRRFKSDSELQERYASQILEQREWDVNFTPLPKEYKLDYNSIQGNEVTSLALTNRLDLGRGASVFALGLVGECDKAKSYLIMKRAASGGVSYSTYGILKMDKYGNRMGYREIGRSENTGSSFSQMDEFTIKSSGLGNAEVETIQRTGDGEYKETFTHYCGF